MEINLMLGDCLERMSTRITAMNFELFPDCVWNKSMIVRPK